MGVDATPHRHDDAEFGEVVRLINDTQMQGLIMAILTVRLTAEEDKPLIRRFRSAGMKKPSLVRQLIREQPFTTAADVSPDAEERMGERLTATPAKQVNIREPGNGLNPNTGGFHAALP
jgi:hypothetical protein